MLHRSMLNRLLHDCLRWTYNLPVQLLKDRQNYDTKLKGIHMQWLLNLKIHELCFYIKIFKIYKNLLQQYLLLLKYIKFAVSIHD